MESDVQYTTTSKSKDGDDGDEGRMIMTIMIMITNPHSQSLLNYSLFFLSLPVVYRCSLFSNCNCNSP